MSTMKATGCNFILIFKNNLHIFDYLAAYHPIHFIEHLSLFHSSCMVVHLYSQSHFWSNLPVAVEFNLKEPLQFNLSHFTWWLLCSITGFCLEFSETVFLILHHSHLNIFRAGTKPWQEKKSVPDKVLPRTNYFEVCYTCLFLTDLLRYLFNNIWSDQIFSFTRYLHTDRTCKHCCS